MSMVQEQRSAEKDLLKLIENPSEIAAQKKVMDKIRKVPSEKGIFSVFSRMGGKKSQAELIDGEYTGRMESSTGDIVSSLTDRKKIIRVLTFATVAMAGYFLYTFSAEFINVNNSDKFKKFNYIFEGKETEAHANDAVAGAQSAAPSVADTPQAADVDQMGRNVFKPWTQQSESAGQPSTESVSAINDYRLVGISVAADAKDTYAMVENIRTELTFFLKRGEKLAGMELLDITDNKLVFKENDKSVELR